MPPDEFGDFDAATVWQRDVQRTAFGKVASMPTGASRTEPASPTTEKPFSSAYKIGQLGQLSFENVTHEFRVNGLIDRPTRIYTLFFAALPDRERRNLSFGNLLSSAPAARLASEIMNLA